MYCKKCGNKLLEENKFCSSCGQSINELNLQKTSDAKKQKETLGIISIIFGIVLIILVFFVNKTFLNPILLPFSIIGLILGIVNVKKKGKIGIVLNSLVTAILILVLIALQIGYIYIKTFLGHPSTKKEVIKYLEEKYNNESFEIISVEHIEKMFPKCGSDDNTILENPGNIYTVKSLTSNIQFTVKDIYVHRGSTPGCDYELEDNYLPDETK